MSYRFGPKRPKLIIVAKEGNVTAPDIMSVHPLCVETATTTTATAAAMLTAIPQAIATTRVHITTATTATAQAAAEAAVTLQH